VRIGDRKDDDAGDHEQRGEGKQGERSVEEVAVQLGNEVIAFRVGGPLFRREKLESGDSEECSAGKEECVLADKTV
jgi:hypothetical protein